MKLFLLALLAAGCMPARSINSNVQIESGFLSQGSDSWKENNLCEAGKTGLCIEAVRGPFVLTEVDSGESCSHSLLVGINDTYHNASKIDPNWTVETKNHWSMVGPENNRLYIKDVKKFIPAGESLFFGTVGFNDMVDKQCYVTWSGYKPND